MSLIWNLDLSTKICTYISIIFFLLANGNNWGWVIVFCGLTYFWSDIDEDDIGDDLEEYIEFFLDEFGLFDKWSNNVIESLEKYEDLKDHYKHNYSDQYTEAFNVFTRRDEDYLHAPIDHDYFREHKEQMDHDLELFLWGYLRLGNQYEYKYRGLNESQIENLKTAQTFYDSIHNTFNVKFTDKDDIPAEMMYDYDHVDQDFADYLYIYKFAEKYYDWFHTSNYPPLNNTIRDWEELYLEQLIDKYDKKERGKLLNDQYNIISMFLINKNTNLFNYSDFYYLNKRKELFSQPYPFLAIKENNYYVIHKNNDRWRNTWDYHLIKDLYYYSDFKELDKILIQQEFIDTLILNNYVIKSKT